MPLTAIPLPFGLRDVKVRPLVVEAPGTSVDFPNAQTLSFSETQDYEELRGDDGVVATHGMGVTVDWELEGGGLPLDAVKIMYGGVITDSGTAPNQKRVYTRNSTDAAPYFQLEGQAISDSGGDLHMLLYRCKATGELTGEFADGSFWTTGLSGRALPRDSDKKVYDLTQNETAVAAT